MPVRTKPKMPLNTKEKKRLLTKVFTGLRNMFLMMASLKKRTHSTFFRSFVRFVQLALFPSFGSFWSSFSSSLTKHLSYTPTHYPPQSPKLLHRFFFSLSFSLQIQTMKLYSCWKILLMLSQSSQKKKKKKTVSFLSLTLLVEIRSALLRFLQNE